jgi:uncharacterized membrane protein YvbJ
MHCPNCGKQTSIEQKFCRSCGMSLETISKAIIAHQSISDSDNPSVGDDSNALRRLGLQLFWGVIVLFMGAVILSISKKMVQSDWLRLVGLATVMAGMILAMYAVLSPLWKQSSKSSQMTEPKSTMELENRAQTLPELPSAPPTITEQTTSILDSEVAKMLGDKRSKVIES